MGAQIVTKEGLEDAFSRAGIADLPPAAYDKFLSYLTVLVRWNSRLNLTAIREPEQIVQRHFVECAFAAQLLPRDIGTLLDYGSGAGFPGIPFAICRSEIGVALAEAHAKKASFLREVARVLDLPLEIRDRRIEATDTDQTYDAVAMRAVESMESAIPIAARLARQHLVLFTTEDSIRTFQDLAPGFFWPEPVSVPNARRILVAIGTRTRILP